jgi:hypothetical protein
LISFFNRKDAKSAKIKYFSFAVERSAKEKNQSHLSGIFFYNKCPQGLLLVVFRPLNGKQQKNNLSGLCGSNERSEWAVSYGI